MYQRQAQGLASLGRGPDTELVHMTPREVGALNTLARQNGLDGLPTNPQTGLPEAGIFDSLAPILIGAGAAAAAPFTGGGSLAAFLSSPLLMGSTAALGAGIASGFDAAEMAKWGLGIYGGANLAGSLSAAGSAPAAGGAAGTGGTAVAPTTGGTTLAGATQPLTTDAIQKQAIAEAGKKLSAEEAAKIAAKDLTQKQLGTAARDLTLQGGDKFFQFTPEVGKQQFAAMGRGILNPKIAASTVGKAPIMAGIGSVAADQYSQMKDVEPFEFPKKEPPFYPEGGFMSPPRTSIDPFAGVPADVDFSEERMFFDPAPFTSPGYMPAKAGGLVSLKGGGLTRGPGDGMSDDIMLPITGSRDIAAVSPGEFVVSADVVSGLGNGSTSAGAKQLYGMMDRVRDARTGKTAQPRAIDAGKMMPA